MARRAPFVAFVLLPGSGAHVGGGDFWCLVLHEFKVRPCAEGLVLRQGLKRVRRGCEGVHQHELEICLELLLHGGYLLSNQVQKAVALRDLEQRFGLLQTHASSKSSVQFQDECFLQQPWIWLRLDRFVSRQGLDRVELRLRDHDISTGRQNAIGVLEGRDSSIVASILGHFLLERRPHRSHLRRAHRLDNVHEAWLQRGPAHQEAVNVGLRDELGAIVRSHAASILDSDLLRNSRSNSLLDVGTDSCLSLLSLLWSCNLASTDCPNRFVCDDDLVPVLDAWDARTKLTFVHLICFACFPLFEKLSDAKDCAYTGRLALGHLLSGISISFTILCAAF
mmetsp:Transcript_44002/g.79094  ORF Transcript_44002/g.79094 Transcript_44002/m.79094 type:complete len:337 (+) Transcript_44002:315-1325(+)